MPRLPPARGKWSQKEKPFSCAIRVYVQGTQVPAGAQGEHLDIPEQKLNQTFRLEPYSISLDRVPIGQGPVSCTCFPHTPLKKYIYWGDVTAMLYFQERGNLHRTRAVPPDGEKGGGWRGLT